MTRMKVSVIVPIYNVEKYISACARSLFEQTFKDVEYIFVNDCATDHSLEILKDVAAHYALPHCQFISHEHNRGSGAARLTGMEHASGDFVMFVDSDDLVPANAVETLVRRQAETGADMVDGATDSFAEDAFFDRQLPFKGPHFVERLIIGNTVPHHVWGRLIRRSVFTDHDIHFTEGVNQAEDYSVIPRVAYYASRAWTDTVVYHYRVDRSGSFTDGISPKHLRSFLKANQIITSFFQAKEKKFLYPLQVGLINTGYLAVKAGASLEQVRQALAFRPHGCLFRLADHLLTHQPTVHAARLEYLVLKRLYLQTH